MSVFLPMVKEEFREHLEALSTALKEEANERASESMQSLLLSVFEDVSLRIDLLCFSSGHVFRMTVWTRSSRN